MLAARPRRPRPGPTWSAALVCALLAAGAALLLAWGGYDLVAQADGLIAVIGDQLRALAQLLLPDPGTLFGTAYSAFSIGSGWLGNAVVVVSFGLFAAADPGTYRRGVLALLPRDRRRRVGEVLDEVAVVLRWWLVGQLVAVVLIALSTWLGMALTGMPGAFLLGLQAGLVNFIPYPGPVIAAVPIGLAAMAQGTAMVAWALGVATVTQAIEGYVLAR